MTNRPPGIPRRQLDLTFDPDRVPRDWFNDDPFVTTFLNGLSILFPEGERFFVDAVKRYKDRVTDPELAARVVGFVGQEAMHGKEHRSLNEMIEAHGYQVPALEAHVTWLLGVARRIHPRFQLGATCALEHFTAILAEALLGQPDQRKMFDPALRGLWTWHAFEESEHKAVAYDVYMLTGVRYPERVAVMIVTTIIFFAELVHYQARLLARRGILHKPWRWLRGLSTMWIRPGYFRKLIPAYFSYYRPGFHPDDRDATALLDAWYGVLFGKDGELSAALKGTHYPNAATEAA
jgi:predicted metal-dependent hydrolase